MKKNILFIIACICFTSSAFIANAQTKKVWVPDNSDGTYKNPVIYADYSDPDVIRVGKDFYMVSSSFSQFPGLPILHSNDLVNWKIIGHAVINYPYTLFDTPQHGNGIWAPSIRYHDGEFLIYYGDPDYGIFMTKTKNPAGKWEPLKLIKEAKGWIDPCPLWDDDGNVYLVHAWANSRAGIKSILTVNKLNKAGDKVIDEGTLVFDGHKNHPTIEGPKFYKRNGYYYIFAPAGGVKPGWQTVLRSKNIYGPYEDRVVMEQGSTNINGPHQGGWVELESGESWFIHFQDKDAYGRVVLLEPMKWIDDVPLIGIDFDGNGIGEPVSIYNKPNVGKEYPVTVPQTSDEFDTTGLGFQWQWEANYKDEWFSLSENKGNLRSFSVPVGKSFDNLTSLPNVVGQKFPAPSFNVTTELSFNPKTSGERTGIVVLGSDYAALTISKADDGYYIEQSFCPDAFKGGKENTNERLKVSSGKIYFKVFILDGGICSFAYSLDNKYFHIIGKQFTAVPGRWVGARIGLFSISPDSSNEYGYTDYNWIRFTN